MFTFSIKGTVIKPIGTAAIEITPSNLLGITRSKLNVGKKYHSGKISSGVGVERIFPVLSPAVEKIEVNKEGSVRRARIYYLRGLTGKKARIKEKRG